MLRQLKTADSLRWGDDGDGVTRNLAILEANLCRGFYKT